jgi:hypothetical protein
MFERYDDIAAIYGGSPIRSVIDPINSLPEVEFRYEQDVSEPSITAYQYRIMHDATMVGVTRIAHQQITGNMHFQWLEINEPFRSQKRGFGMAAYVNAIEGAHLDRHPFATDQWLSADACRVWGRFIDMGIAEVVRPIRYGQQHDGEDYWTGLLRIPPTFYENV